MRNYQAIERALELFEQGVYRYEDGKIFNKDKELRGWSKARYLTLSVTVDGKSKAPHIHNIIYALKHGIEELRKHEAIDHINGEKHDNRIENLEGCTLAENNRRWRDSEKGRTYYKYKGWVRREDRVKVVREKKEKREILNKEKESLRNSPKLVREQELMRELEILNNNYKKGCEFIMRKIEENKNSRKVRSDKKRDVKPTIPVHLKRTIYRLSDICDIPVKDIGVILCAEGVHSRDVMELLKPNLRRDIRLGSTIYFGNLENLSLQRKTDKSLHEKITIKFTAEDFEDVALLAHALDVTPSRATAILLDASIRDPDFIHTLMKVHSKRKRLTEEHQAELKKVMQYINSENPYKSMLMWADLIMYVGDFVVNGWRKVE